MGGGSESTVTPNVQQQPEPNYGNIPGFSALAGAATNQMGVFGPYSQAGSGPAMLPSGLLGQTQLAGPNNTNIGRDSAGNLTSSPYTPPANGGGQGGGAKQGGSGPAVGGSNVSPLATGNTSFGSILNSLGGLLGNTGVPQGFAQGLTGGQQTGANIGAAANGATTQAPYSNMGNQQAYPGGSQGGPPIAGQSQTSAPSSTQSTPATGSRTPNVQNTPGSSTAMGTPSTTQVGQHIPNTVDSTYAQTPTAVPQATSNSFMGANMTSPYYNQAAVAGNLGTSSGQSVGSAGNFMNSLFSPGLSQMSQDYLQAGAANAGQNLAQGINQLQSQYQTDPFNNQLGNAEANLMSQTANNTLQTAAGMGIQQQQIAANQMSTPYNLTEQAAAAPVQDAQGLFNTATTQYNQGTAMPLSLLGQTPVSSPVVGSTTTSSSSLF